MNDQQVMHAMNIDDAYHVERVLASGAGGVTELVTLDGSGPFVRKRIPTKLARRGVWGTLTECGCARLPRVEATYEMPDEFVVVCDYVPGENLEELVRSTGRVGEKDACQVVGQLCEAAGALHAHGIVHRDISPRNVIVAADGAHLIDLGIARFRSEGATHDTTQLGTFGFASPEQHGFAQTDARSDVYSIGRVLGYLLTGVMPEVPDAADYERALADEAVVSPQMRTVIERACALEPSARFQSADELAAALEGRKAPDAGGVGVGTKAPPALGVPGGASASRVASAKRRGPSFAQLVIGLMAVIVLLAAIVLVMHGAGLLGADTSAADGSGGNVAQIVESVRQNQKADPGASVGSPVSEPDSTDENLLEIVDSGWSVGSGGYINYAIALRNNSADKQVDFPTVTITGLSADGSIAFSQDQVLGVIYPGQTVWWAAPAGNGTAPGSVEFTVAEPDDYNVSTATGDASIYSLSNLSVVEDGFGSESFTGEVTLEREGDERFGMGSVAIVVVLRDESGKIVYGNQTFVDSPGLGASKSFEVSCYGLPDYASYEVYALAW